MGRTNQNIKSIEFKEKITNNSRRYQEEEKYVLGFYLLVINYQTRGRSRSLQEILRIVTDSLKKIRTEKHCWTERVISGRALQQQSQVSESLFE